MPFGLTNAGATYQLLMTKTFYPMSGKTMDHCAYLQQAFNLLWYFEMKLNSAKCAFNISTGKFLGFLVTERGIEIDPT